MDFNIETLEFLDLIEFCTSPRFKEKYRHQYGSHLVSLFQEKILASFAKRKPISLVDLIKFLSVKHRYNEEVVKAFLKEIDIEIYYPIVSF